MAVRALVAPERREEAVGRLRHYAANVGVEFDRLIDHGHPNEITEEDFRAVSKLNVNVLIEARPWLRGEGHDRVYELLDAIPTDRDIWQIDEDEFDSIFGEHSPAWELWDLISDLQKGAGRSGRWVTAGKLLHGKRPRLIPIYDDKAVKPTLHVTQRTVWEAFWCTFRHSDVREQLAEIQAAVPKAEGLSLLRVLDIITWMSVEDSGKS
jgi:hypothetical protein